ncbi:FAD:protein FMN transferase [Mobilitalea sibirica]|uniref:FAD:protein FMN transferase n=1 Tax=Mobilitalea sibirica TaxID=1462919 RepID=A0A8J7H1N3_9FIRM|nr:FAD:protein FMN transferase [Mobilitalea sibirica]MBH1940409.1 FAD:protein FMN transferase [Mobilitalea sibirica]
MRKKLILCFIMTVVVLSLTACKTVEKKRYSAEFLELFNTVTKIVGYSEKKEEFSEFAQLVYDNLKEYHELYDKYNEYEGINNIKTINDNAGIKPIKVDQRIIDLLNYSKEAYEFTNGKVNIAFGAVLEIWHDYRSEGIDDPMNAKLPPMDLLLEKSKHTDINNIIINEEESTVYLSDPDMRLDVGAIAKGYATERVMEIVTEKGYTGMLLSVGGNVRAIGGKIKEKDPWNVGIQNPDLESDIPNLYILNLIDFSLVSSGDYERYYTVDGQRYHHIIDPNTLMPADYFAAISIVCEDSGMADALSTAVYNMPYEEGLKLIESIPDTEALWIYKDGKMKQSSGFETYVKTKY